MTRKFYQMAFVASFVLCTGIMFEFLKWPYRGIIVFIGLLLLNFGVIPMFFYEKIRKAKV